MVIVSHDREFLDQLCTKIVHTEWGLAATYRGNYSQFTLAREEAVAQQWAAWEKQQKEIARQVSKRCSFPGCFQAWGCCGSPGSSRRRSPIRWALSLVFMYISPTAEPFRWVFSRLGEAAGDCPPGGQMLG